VSVTSRLFWAMIGGSERFLFRLIRVTHDFLCIELFGQMVTPHRVSAVEPNPKCSVGDWRDDSDRAALTIHTPDTNPNVPPSDLPIILKSTSICTVMVSGRAAKGQEYVLLCRLAHHYAGKHFLGNTSFA